MSSLKKIAQGVMCTLAVALMANAANAANVVNAAYKYDEQGYSGSLEVKAAQNAKVPNSSEFEFMTASDDGYTCYFSGVGVIQEGQPFNVYDTSDEKSYVQMLYSNDTFYLLQINAEAAPCGIRGNMLGRYVRDFGE